MSKKRKLSKSQASERGRKQISEDSWRAALNETAINEDHWQCMVTMMVETLSEHTRCVSFFNLGAEDGKRKAIFSLSHQKSLDAVKLLSKQSLEKCPIIQGVCHYASKILNEDNGVLPGWLMAQVIKYMICRAKEEQIGIVKKLTDLERKIDEEYLIMQTVANWGQPKSKNFSIETFNSKANTRLRKRSEEWRDAVYVDDAPSNGPNLYVILTGFHDPDLPEHLINAGVPLTCIIRIKRPNEQLDQSVKPAREASLTTRKLQCCKMYHVDKVDLYNFWTVVEKQSMEPQNYPYYCDIAFITYCPPELPETSDENEYEDLKKEMYDSVSYFVYDIYDVYRQHDKYLQTMKVNKNIVGVDQEKVNIDVYETSFDGIPPECVTVSVVLLAMLKQIEENGEKKEIEYLVDEKGDAKIVPEAISSESVNQSSISFIQQKLEALNLKFDLNEQQIFGNDELNLNDIGLIQGDPLNEDIHLLRDPATLSNLRDNIQSIFWHPCFTSFDSQSVNFEKKHNEYYHHIDSVRHYFDDEVNLEEIKHYLHILMLDRIIFEQSKPETKMIMSDNAMYIKTPKRSKSFPDLTSKSTHKIHFRSDGNIDYGKIMPTFLECAPLFDLIDFREFLIPGYLEGNVFKKRTKYDSRLEDYNDVEVLSMPMFLQLFQECLQTFDYFKSEYFEPTNSLLLYFGYKRVVNGVHREENIYSIRTPVCLRDFNEYVVPEEEEWIRWEEEMNNYLSNEAIAKLSRKSTEMYDESLLFQEEDFILPGSLKAKDLEKLPDHSGKRLQMELSNVEESKNEKKKRKQSTDRSEFDKLSLGSTRDLKTPSKQSYLSVKMVEKEPEFNFDGYDLGRLRVQIKYTNETFYSADDTMVRVEIDDWLYKNKDLRITVTVYGCSLRLYQQINNSSSENSKIFHLTTKLGIILSFEKSLIPTYKDTDFDMDDWQETSVKFKASWPTGLLTEPVVGTGPDNPFYICQSYAISKGIINRDHEVCRKFLRNGTVLKYLDDGKIIVLRPNGAIVTCIDFEKVQFKEDDTQNDDANIQIGDRPTEKTKQSKSKKQLRSQTVEEPSSSTSVHQNSDNVLSAADTSVKVLRYTVLDHDGRRYEVVNDLVVNEPHRLLVRTASDYEVDEKFTRRADGTNMLLKSNGELIVEFPDGTRIISGYIIERNLVTCDWSEEEIQQYFIPEETPELNIRSVSFATLKHPEVDDWSHSSVHNEDVTKLLIEDSFVSVLLTCRVEHKNYSTVFYDQSTVSCTLSMPDEVRVSISARGDYEVSVADRVNLKVIGTVEMKFIQKQKPNGILDFRMSKRSVSFACWVSKDLLLHNSRVKIKEDSVSLKGTSCTFCGNQSTSTYNFFAFESPAVIFSTKDVFENVFEVKNDGTTSYRRRETSRRQKSGSNADFLVASGNEESYQNRPKMEYEDDEFFEQPCDHEMMRFQPSDICCRIFAIDQNLTGYEYLHRSVSNQMELMAAFDNETSVILYPSSHKPELRRLITLEPLKSETRSKTLLTFQYPELKPTNFDRRALLRSTYSIPYNWPFPFGRNGDGIWKTSHDLPLISSLEQNLPKLLKIRVLYGFKEKHVNAIVDLQRALGRYWIAIQLAKDKHESFIREQLEMEKLMQEETRTAIYQHLEKNLHNLAFGIIKRIDVKTYKEGLTRYWKAAKKEVPERSTKFDELLKETATCKEKFEWYKRCMRERIILPYFQNITGFCFLLIEEYMENAVKISQANKLAAKIDKNDEEF